MSLMKGAKSQPDLFQNFNEEENKYQKVSYRQKGGRLQGSVLKGSTSNAYVKTGVGSVPSKFETIVWINPDAKKKGFGSNVARFNALQESEDPGPGQYQTKTNINHLMKHSDSYSRKGLGNGFISKVDRFKDNKWENYWLPGPGQYSDSIMTTQSSFQPDKTLKNAGSCVFKSSTAQELPQKQATQLGPGQYEVSKALKHNAGPQLTSMFKSTSQKQHYHKVLPNPPPGTYEHDVNDLINKTQQTYNLKQHTSSFHSNSNCRRVKVNLYDPFNKIEDGRVPNPGPGTYDYENGCIHSKVLEKMSMGVGSAVFTNPQMAHKADDKKIAESLMGPGKYDLETPKEKQACSSHMFKSDSLREIIDVRRGPGPAYYNKIKEKKCEAIKNQQSHNFNPKHQWL